jgi:hypothetical protein
MLRVIGFLSAALLLSGCITSYKPFREPKEPTCVAYTTTIKAANDWSHVLPDIYPGIRGCLKAHPSYPAFAGDVIPGEEGIMIVRMQGSDGSIYECRTAPKSLTPIPQGFDSPGPSFRPGAMGKPEPDRCLRHERVNSCSGLLLGWISYFKC